MTAPHYARLVARALRGDDSEATREVSAQSRAAGIGAVEAAMALRERRRRRSRVFALTSVAAAVLLGVFGLSQFSMRERTIAAPSTGLPLAQDVRVTARSAGADSMLVGPAGAIALHDGGELAPGRSVITGAHASAAFELSTGTRLVVDPASQLALLDNRRTQRFELRAGAMHASVAKLAAGERFIIGTPDAEIEVHGTAFRVEVLGADESCAGSRTRVIVTEGVVSVRHAGVLVHIPAGSRWPAACAPVAPAPIAAPALPQISDGAGRAVAAVPEAHRHKGTHTLEAPLAAAPEPERSAPSDAASALAEQNVAFGRAVAQARAGDRHAALGAFSDFLSRYPASQLRESATVEHLRLLIELDPSRARDAARNYLQAYPDGAARHEAERAIEGPP